MLAEKMKIMIYNREFDVEAGTLTPLEASAMAQYVTDKMKEIEDQTKIVDTSRLAALAALNITEELFRLKQSRSLNDGSLDKKNEELVSLLDSALNDRFPES